jgi:hypothetical protein
MQIKGIFLGLVIALTLNSCANSIAGNVLQEDRTIASFNNIGLASAYEVRINNGANKPLEMEAYESLCAPIKHEVRNKTIFIKRAKAMENAELLKLYITLANLAQLNIYAAIQLWNKAFFSAKNLAIDMRVAVAIVLAFAIENLTLKLKGVRASPLNGNIDNFEIVLLATGGLDVKKLQANNTKIDISGRGVSCYFC